MECLQELTNLLSNGSTPDPLQPSVPKDWGFATPPKTPITMISGTGKDTDFKFGRYIRSVRLNYIQFNRPIKKT